LGAELTFMQLLTGFLGEIQPKLNCRDATGIVLTCSGMVKQSTRAVHACTFVSSTRLSRLEADIWVSAGLHKIIAFTANDFNAQSVALQWLPAYMRSAYRDGKRGEDALLAGYVYELAKTSFGLDIFVFPAVGDSWRYTWGGVADNFTGNPVDLACPKCHHEKMELKGKKAGGLEYLCYQKTDAEPTPQQTVPGHCSGRKTLHFKDGEHNIYQVQGPGGPNGKFRVLKIKLDLSGEGNVRMMPPPRDLPSKWQV
jgi:hypothetical protein